MLHVLDRPVVLVRSKMNVPMNSMPRIRLRTIFLLLICAAVGLTCGSGPTFRDAGGIPGLSRYFNFYYVALATSSVAMVIGLAQQVRALYPAAVPAREKQADFAVRFDIVWRIGISITLLLCMLCRILATREFVQLPRTEIFEIFPECVWLICVIIVLASSIGRWRPQERRGDMSRTMQFASWVACIALGLVILSGNTVVHFLVYVALGNIEATQPGKFHRLGAYPSQQAAGFSIFWLALLNVAIATLAIAVYSSIRSTDSSARRRLKGIVWVSCLVAAAALCLRYYFIALQPLAPDITAVGFQGNWLDRAGGAAIAVFTVSVIAYRLARSDQRFTVQRFAANDREQVSLHETFIIQSFVFAAAFARSAEMFSVNVIMNISRFAWSDFIGYFFLDATNMLCVSILTLSLQFARICWTRRNQQIEWRLPLLNSRTFALNWLAVAALLIVLIPSAAEYCFASWLGPWYLYGPK